MSICSCHDSSDHYFYRKVHSNNQSNFVSNNFVSIRFKSDTYYLTFVYTLTPYNYSCDKCQNE